MWRITKLFHLLYDFLYLIFKTDQYHIYNCIIITSIMKSIYVKWAIDFE